MYAFVRFTAAAALIAFGTIIALGAVLLVPPVVEKIRVARTERPAPPAIQCEQDCPAETVAALDLPGLAPGDAPNVTPSFALSAASSAAPSTAPSATPSAAPSTAPSSAPVIEPRVAGYGAATVDEPSSTGHASGLRAAEPPPAALIFEKPAPHSELPALERTQPALERTPTIATPEPQPRPVAKPKVRPQPKVQARVTEPKEAARVAEPREPAPRPARPARTAKRSNNDALRAVRRFGDDLQDIPVNSFSGDGRPRTIMIRPTSVQDVYYYSRER